MPERKCPRCNKDFSLPEPEMGMDVDSFRFRALRLDHAYQEHLLEHILEGEAKRPN